MKEKGKKRRRNGGINEEYAQFRPQLNSIET